MMTVAEALQRNRNTLAHAMILAPDRRRWRGFETGEIPLTKNATSRRTSVTCNAFTRTAFCAAALLTAASTLSAVAQSSGAHPAGDLKIYFADVEGGQATLFVTPTHDSMLVDTGWPGFEGRDADRIVALCKEAGIAKIDTVVLTHFHTDHVGGVPQLADRLPIGRFIDHGPNREQDGGITEEGFKLYQQVLTEKHIPRMTAHVGEVLPVQGMRVEVVSADGEVLAKSLAGAGATNPACAASPQKALEKSENDRSVGLMITFGKLRILDLGDLTWAKERPLMCPVDKLGKVDIYIVSHHGMDRSGSPALVDAIAPRVAIMDNGGTKGGVASSFDTLERSPRLKDLWQLHTAEGSDAAHNTLPAHTANLSGPTDAGHSLLLTAHPDGTFSVLNERTGTTVNYPAEAK